MSPQRWRRARQRVAVSLLALGSLAGLALSASEHRLARPGSRHQCRPGDPGATVLAWGAHQSFAGKVVVDGTNVYWSDPEAEALLTVPKTARTAAPLVLAGGQVEPRGLALHGGALYWTVGAGEIRRVGLAPRWLGGTVEVVLRGEHRPATIAVDDSGMYWLTPTAVRALPRGHARPRTLAPAEDPRNLVLDAAAVYWRDDRCVRRVPKSGAARDEVLVSSQAAHIAGLAVDAEHLYWSEDRGAGGALLRAPKSGGRPVTIDEGPHIKLIRVDPRGPSWRSSRAHAWISQPGGSAMTADGCWIADFALDGRALFVLTAPGTVLRVPRPRHRAGGRRSGAPGSGRARQRRSSKWA